MLRSLIYLFILFLLNLSGLLRAETGIRFLVHSGGKPVAGARVQIDAIRFSGFTDSNGTCKTGALKKGRYSIRCSAELYYPARDSVVLEADTGVLMRIELLPQLDMMKEFVVSGTLKHVRRSESPVSVEVYNSQFFKKNPAPALFDALQNINGVRPQLNCNVCNTGDIHINGLEGPYTMILIDGMPLVSSLSTVYGLSGIPASMVDRIEVVKGPASSLYGSEAVGGLINVITKNPLNAPLCSADVFCTSWGEVNADLSLKLKAGKKTTVLNGLNAFGFGQRKDENRDGFTDVTLQERVSFFQKWSIGRKSAKPFTMAARLLSENRWGGDMRWNPSFRGGDSLYAEDIKTRRFELTGNYQLPFRERIMISASYVAHSQNSFYGTTGFNALQHTAFAQAVWDKNIKRHDVLAGAGLRYTHYNDNTPATAKQAQLTALPGIFVQDEYKLNRKHALLGGLRCDYHSAHGAIVTPRLAWKWKLNPVHVFRLNAGTGFRTVNIFTEDHAALTGARQLLIREALKPEQSLNINLNLLSRILLGKQQLLGLDLSVFNTRFSNRIIADYETDVNKIIYDNLEGYAVSRGISLNLDLSGKSRIKATAGATYMEVFYVSSGIKTMQILTEKFSGTWSLSYALKNKKLSLDYTGNVYSPMRLPLLGPLDPRKPYSPWWSLQNLQLVYHPHKTLRLYGGIKNLLDFTPMRGNPFIIARSHDPFDKQVQFAPDGTVLPSAENPYALSFDPNYVYAPNQGLRVFLGLAYTLN